jgi:hypothetical protein
MCIGEHQRLCGSPTMVVSVVLGEVASCDGLLNVKHWVTTERGQNGEYLHLSEGGRHRPYQAQISPFGAASQLSATGGAVRHPRRFLPTRSLDAGVPLRDRLTGTGGGLTLVGSASPCVRQPICSNRDTMIPSGPRT